MISTSQRDELRRLLAAVTPGQWTADEWFGSDEGGWCAIGPHRQVEDGEDDAPDSDCHKAAQRDSALLAAAVNALPALLDGIERLASLNDGLEDENLHLRAENAEWRAACEGIQAASPTTLRTALREAEEIIRRLREEVRRG